MYKYFIFPLTFTQFVWIRIHSDE